MQGLMRVIWPLMMFVLAALITIVIFLAAVAPGDRGIAFYVGMAVLCGGEFIIFAWVINYWISRQGRGLSGATLRIIHLMMIWWFLIALPVAMVVGGMAGWRYSRWHDVAAELLAVMTFLFFLGATMIYAKDLELQAEDRATRPERIELQVWVTAMEQACDQLRHLASEQADHAVAVDRLTKKLDAVRTSLQHAPPGKIGVHEEEGGRSASQYNARIVVSLEELQAKLSKACAGGQETPARLRELDELASRLESLLRQRQQFLLVGGAH